MLRCARDTGMSRCVTVEKLDRNALRAAQEGYPHARAHRGRLPRKLGAFRLELRHHRVDAADTEPEMIEPLVRRIRRRIDPVAWRHRRNEDIRAAELEIDAGLSLLHAADDFRAEH